MPKGISGNFTSNQSGRMRAHMKYIVVLCDGMADEPLLELDGMTPMEAAKTPNMDRMAQISEIGMVQTIPSGMAPGSDTGTWIRSTDLLYRTISIGGAEYRGGYGTDRCFLSLQSCDFV